MDFQAFFGVAPWVVATAVATWVGRGFQHRRETLKDELTHTEKVEAHRDELTLQLLANARLEMSSTKGEMDELRKEVKTLRSLETHIYHFEQSLDHLEAILVASTQDERGVAERNARAFLARMRRIADAKGTLRNEVQRLDSTAELIERAAKESGHGNE